MMKTRLGEEATDEGLGLRDGSGDPREARQRLRSTETNEQPEEDSCEDHSDSYRADDTPAVSRELVPVLHEREEGVHHDLPSSLCPEECCEESDDGAQHPERPEGPHGEVIGTRSGSLDCEAERILALDLVARVGSISKHGREQDKIRGMRETKTGKVIGSEPFNSIVLFGT